MAVLEFRPPKVHKVLMEAQQPAVDLPLSMHQPRPNRTLLPRDLMEALHKP